MSNNYESHHSWRNNSALPGQHGHTAWQRDRLDHRNVNGHPGLPGGNFNLWKLVEWVRVDNHVSGHIDPTECELYLLLHGCDELVEDLLNSLWLPSSFTCVTLQLNITFWSISCRSCCNSPNLPTTPVDYRLN